MGKTIENLAGRGIRAKVIHGGYQYSTYTEFAVEAGYPDAAHDTGAVFSRTIDAENLVGDYVDVLAKGKHTRFSDIVYVCQTDDGKRFLIGEQGLRVVEKPATLKDATIDQLIAELKARVEQAVADEEGTAVMEFMPESSPIRTRAGVVERAQGDVKGIIKRGRTISQSGGGEGNDAYRNKFYHVDFTINSEKRTVVALIRLGDRLKSNIVAHRGIAKCDPNDCFNEHIGKAIALRRAFELDVPSEYLNAPAPEGFRVGDGIVGVMSGVKGTVEKVDGLFEVEGVYEDGDELYGPKSHYKVIDDSARY